MTLPVSGAISFNNINVELGVAGTTQASLGQASYRTLAGVPTGAISMSNFYGKSNRVSASYTFSANTANATLNLSTVSGYSAGTTDITVTINSGVYLYSTSTGGYGLSLTGGTVGDTLTIVNNGYIMGMGGTGSTGTNGPVGGPALNLGFAMSSCTINNTNASAYIGGGGGGGAYGGYAGGGGGAGGAPGGRGGDNSQLPGGSGGGIGQSGSAGGWVPPGGGQGASGGGGGRIFPGTGGTGGSNSGGGGGGAGGGGGGWNGKGSGTGGAGGGANNPGGVSSPNSGTLYGGYAGGGGGWGASGGNTGAPTGNFGGAGGKAVNTNGKSVTWTSGNTTRVYGSVS